MARLVVVYPEIAADFDASRNENLHVEDLQPYDKQPVWWVCKDGHSYEVSPYTRVRTKGCKVCNKHTTPRRCDGRSSPNRGASLTLGDPIY